jgi:hypothetical protein
MIVVAIKDGTARSVCSDDPLLVGREVVVIDHDCEGANPAEVERVPQLGGKAEDALIHGQEVGRLPGWVARFLKARPR